MPQIDRHKNRTVFIEFISNENFENIPYKERLTLIFITSGSINVQLNGWPFKITAPSILCLSMNDTIEILEKDIISSQSFCFHPDFLNTAHFSESEEYLSTKLKIETGLSLFMQENGHNRVHIVTEKAYIQLFEWFFVMGMEVYAQSDSLWVCGIVKFKVKRGMTPTEFRNTSREFAVSI